MNIYSLFTFQFANSKKRILKLSIRLIMLYIYLYTFYFYITLINIKLLFLLLSQFQIFKIIKIKYLSTNILLMGVSFNFFLLSESIIYYFIYRKQKYNKHFYQQEPSIL